jgi:hypothetical protein
MRCLLLAPTSVLVLSLCALLGGKSDEGPVSVRLRLLDDKTGKGVAGIVRIFPEGKDVALPLPGLLNRLRGLGKTELARGWHVIPAAGVEVSLPRGKLRLEAVSGLETNLARQDIDLTQATPKEITARLRFLFRPDEDGLYAGNTHLHLRNMTLAEADDYLRQIPAADRLAVMFVSYLERKDDDRTYISNRYPVGELKHLKGTGVLFNNGEEHRHNFEAFGQGYGHVMFLDIKELVKPVSLGPGITGAGDDDRPLREGIDNARKQGGFVLWCHNTSGQEDVPSVFTGRLDALNVFDGSRTGRFEDAYYLYLNTGLRLPISTGTDWFLYDFSRVYARVKGELTVKSWLAALKEGRDIATNGPLLRLTVDGAGPGEVLKLKDPKKVRIVAEGVGRHDFGRLELVHNGRVVQAARATGKAGGYAARLEREVRISEPGWLAVRIDGSGRNEFDRPLYAHSSPVYIDFQGHRPFDLDAAQKLLRQVEEGRADIRAKGRFSTPKARDRIIGIYDAAAEDLRTRINRRGRP